VIGLLLLAGILSFCESFLKFVTSKRALSAIFSFFGTVLTVLAFIILAAFSAGVK
jgi:hypothetical protein